MEQRPVENDSTVIEGNKSGAIESGMNLVSLTFSSNAMPIEKVCAIPTGKLETIGGWYVVTSLKALGKLLSDIFNKLHERWPALIYSAFCAVVLTSYLGFYIWYLAEYELGTITWITTVLLSAFCLLYIVFLLIRVWLLVKNQSEHELFAKIFVGIKFGFAILSVYVFVIITLFYKNFTGLVFLFAAFSSEPVHFLAFLACCALTPLILSGLLVEFVIRAVTCNLDCGTYKEIMATYQYAVFKSSQVITAAITPCGLCGKRFNRTVHDLCIINCTPEHLFHERCIIEHLKRDRACPVCGSDIVFKMS